MDEISALFPEEKNGPSKKQAVILTSIIGLIGASVMAIAFYGLGPMLVKPASSVKPTTTDVAEVLGLTNQQQSGTRQLSNSQLETILKLISQQVELPMENTVTGYQITDINLFKSDSFFEQAVNGDVLILFQPSKKAFLYSPMRQRILGQGELK